MGTAVDVVTMCNLKAWSFLQTNGEWIGEIISATAAVILVVIAFVTAVTAIRSMHHSRRSSDAALAANIDAANTAEGSFLLRLDEMFEGQNYIESRQKFAALGREFEAVASAEHDISTPEYFADLQRLFTAELDQLYDTDVEEYMRLTKICGLFETMGIMARRKLIDETLIIGLYGYIILHVAERMEPHIRGRQRGVRGEVRGYLENFLHLSDAVRQQRGLLKSKKPTMTSSYRAILSKVF